MDRKFISNMFRYLIWWFVINISKVMSILFFFQIEVAAILKMASKVGVSMKSFWGNPFFYQWCHVSIQKKVVSESLVVGAGMTIIPAGLWSQWFFASCLEYIVGALISKCFSILGSKYVRAEIPVIASVDSVGHKITIFCSLFQIYSKVTNPQCAVNPL